MTYEQIKNMRKLKIIFTCKICKKDIETFWDKYNRLDGLFICHKVHYSHLFQDFLPLPKEVICFDCFYHT